MAKEDKKNTEEKPLINCLKNEQVIVRYLPKQSRMVSNPKHVLFGGMAENATRTFVVPMLSSGRYVNVLTDDEKDLIRLDKYLTSNTDISRSKISEMIKEGLVLVNFGMILMRLVYQK